MRLNRRELRCFPFVGKLLAQPAGVTFASFFPMRLKVCWICSSVTRLKKGDCSSSTESPCRSVPSKTGSLVVLTKSARTMVSLSVRRLVSGASDSKARLPAGQPRRMWRRCRPARSAGTAEGGRSRGQWPDSTEDTPALLSRFSRCRSVRMSDGSLVTQAAIFLQALLMISSSLGGTSRIELGGGTGS